jgi:hypothetical protein
VDISQIVGLIVKTHPWNDNSSSLNYTILFCGSHGCTRSVRALQFSFVSRDTNRVGTNPWLATHPLVSALKPTISVR